jgi:hypothetical protein
MTYNVLFLIAVILQLNISSVNGETNNFVINKFYPSVFQSIFKVNSILV